MGPFGEQPQSQVLRDHEARKESARRTAADVETPLRRRRAGAVVFLRLRRRRTLQRDLEAELAFHREMAQANSNPIPLGNTTSIKEQALGLWRFTVIENLWRDVLYGVRSLRRSPALVITALASLALG